MKTNFEVEQTAQGKELLACFTNKDAELISKLMERIEAADLRVEQKIIIELTLLERLNDEKKAHDLADVVGDIDTYADSAIAEIGEAIRQKQHISVLTTGIAICAIILLLRSGIDLIKGLIAGNSIGMCMTSIDVGHVIAIIIVLVCARWMVAGDKKGACNDSDKMHRRMNIIGIGAIIALVVLFIPYFNTIVVLQTASIYIAICAIVMLILWKLSN